MGAQNGSIYGDVVSRLAARRDALPKGGDVRRDAGPSAEISRIGEVVSRVVAGESRALSVSARLERKFGVGGRPDRRRALYRRLEAVVAVHGEKAIAVISTAVAQSVAANDPGRYFTVAVTRGLREAGFFSQGDSTW